MKHISTRRAFLRSAAAFGVAAGISGSSVTFAATDRPREVPDNALKDRIGRLVDGFRGDVGVYVRHLPTGRTVRIRADELFPTASMIKVSIMASLFDRIVRGELGYHEKLTYDGKYKYQYENEDILA